VQRYARPVIMCPAVVQVQGRLYALAINLTMHNLERGGDAVDGDVSHKRRRIETKGTKVETAP
jgi:hypothetical protein